MEESVITLEDLGLTLIEEGILGIPNAPELDWVSIGTLDPQDWFVGINGRFFSTDSGIWLEEFYIQVDSNREVLVVADITPAVYIRHPELLMKQLNKVKETGTLFISSTEDWNQSDFYSSILTGIGIFDNSGNTNTWIGHDGSIRIVSSGEEVVIQGTSIVTNITGNLGRFFYSGDSDVIV